MFLWLLASLCASGKESHGLPTAAATVVDSHAACRLSDKRCQALDDDAFVALQLHKAVTSGSARMNNTLESPPQHSKAAQQLLGNSESAPLLANRQQIIPEPPSLSAKLSPPSVGNVMGRDEWKGVRVVDAGLSRTGTESLQAAFMRLGYTVSHGERFKKPGTPAYDAMYTAEYDDQPEAILPYLEKTRTDAVFDAPLDYFWQLFREKYDAKVVLTLHPHGASGWLRSIVNFARWWPIGSVYTTPDHWDILPGCTVQVRPDTKLSDSMAESCKRAYEDYTAAVIAAVPKDRLLVYKVSEGYEPLCKFLGKDVPLKDGKTETFPWIDNVKDKEYVLEKSGGAIPLTWNGMKIFVNGHTPTDADEKLIPRSFWEDLDNHGQKPSGDDNDDKTS